jgi:16S rRNA (guanine527-N7)-methyltransferase
VTPPAEAALRRGAQAILGRALGADEADKLVKYHKLLIKWQKVQRLIGPSDPVTIVEDLLLDALLFVRVLSPSVGSIMDLGSGAGLPGIPLSIVLSPVRVTLVEAKQRRASFLSTAVRELGLQATTVVNARAEALPPVFDRSFDAVVMRCAGPLQEMLPIAARFVSPGGSVVASGPPSREPLAEGRWTNVGCPGRDRDRLFAVVTRYA